MRRTSDPISIGEDDMSDKPYLFTLIVKRKWRKLANVFRTRKALQLMQERDESKLNCLSLALGYQAPMEIIEQIIQLDPDLAFQKDIFGATSLHVACLNGAPTDLVSLLIKSHEDLAYEVDLDNRGPLHHAVEYACDREAVHREDLTHVTYIDVILVLCKAAPDMLYCCDNLGETPIDLVQSMKMKCEVASPIYKKLQAIYLELTEQSIKLFRENKRRWELEGYMARLCLDQPKIEPPSLASTSISNSSSLITPTSEGRDLILDSESIMSGSGIDLNDSKERPGEVLDAIAE